MSEAVPDRMTSARHVAHSGMYNQLGFIAGVVYIVILVPVVLNAVGTEMFGLWSLVTALTGYFGLADLGLTISFVKYLAEFMAQGDSKKVNQVIQHGALFYLLFGLVVLAVAYAAFPFLFALLKLPAEQYDLALALLLLSLAGFCITSGGSTLYGVLASLQRADVSNVLVVCSQAARLAAIAAVLAAGAGLWGMMVADLIVTAAAMVALLALTKKYYTPVSLRPAGFDGALMKKLLRFGAQLQVSRLAEVVQGHFDKLLLSRFVGLSSVTLYDFGSRPLNRARAFPISAMMPIIPAVSALDVEQNRARIRSALIRGTRYLFFVSLPLFGFLSFFAEPIIQVWLGPGFEQSATTMRILALAYFCSVMAGMPAIIAQGLAEPQFQMYAMLIQAGVNVALSLVLVHLFGFFGAVAGTTIAGVGGSILFVSWYGRRLIEAPLRTFAALGTRPLAAMLCAAGAALAIRWTSLELTWAESRLELALWLAAMGVVFLLVYGTLLLKFRCLDEEDKRLVQSVLPGWLRNRVSQ